MRQVQQKIISFLVAVALIALVILIAFGGRIKELRDSGESFGFQWFLAVLYPDKYSYSTETRDLNEFFQLFADDDVAIILQNERIDDRAKYIDGVVYFSLDTVSRLFTNRFYVNEEEGVLLYTTSTDVIKVEIGAESTAYYTSGERTAVDYEIARFGSDGELYIAADYVKKFANFSYTFYESPNRMQVNTSWPTYTVATLKGNTMVRYQGGVKSDVLCPVNEGDTVIVLETMENWTKIQTRDCFIGYVENSRLDGYTEMQDVPVTGAYLPQNDYTVTADAGRILAGFHQVFSPDDGTNLESLTTNTTGMNVVIPTWFYLKDDEGNYTSLASYNYVRYAHEQGYQVWALLEDMTNEFDEYSLFSSSEHRQNLINNLITDATEYGVDGINIDCELVGSATGPHFVQFLRELSIETRKAGLILSVDNYAPNEANRYFNYKEQAYVADYLILMAYDEHWAGSGAGSVSSIDFVETSVENLIDLGVPSGELICAIPFYTRLWKIQGNETTSEAISMDVAQNWLDNRGLTANWDDVTCQYYIEYQDGTSHYLMWLEEDQSIQTKLTVIGEYDVAGVAAWKLGMENERIWTIIDANTK